jgi:hypothetical protein
MLPYAMTNFFNIICSSFFSFGPTFEAVAYNLKEAKEDKFFPVLN